MNKVLILCTGNSCRSQMAEGWLKHFSPDTQVYSAGTHPEGVNKHAIHVMKVAGIDISNHTSNNVNEYINIDLDYVITVCDNAKERCPYFPTTAKKQHHSFEDPANATGTDVEQLLVYRQVRDQIKDYMKAFADNNLNNA
jgi:arsenate reductase